MTKVSCLRLSACQVFLAMFAASTSPQAQAQKLTPGLWEHQFTMKSRSGRIEKGVQEMAKAMASMPPDQRRMMQDMLAQQGMAFGPQGNTVKMCITKEQSERDAAPAAQEGCGQTA